MNRRAGRPQGGPRGSTEQANALAEFLLALTAGSTVRELAARYHVGKTLWGEYRAGLKIIPLELLNRLVRDHTPDEDTRRARLATSAVPARGRVRNSTVISGSACSARAHSADRL